MKFVLNSQNVYDYLVENGLCDSLQEAEQYPSQTSQSNIERITAKNFNLLVTLPDGRKLLVKQEQYNSQGKTAGELFGEWRIQKLLQTFPQLEHWRVFLPELLLYDAEKSIMVSTYLDSYRDLSDFYSKENNFSTKVAAEIGSYLAIVHRDTWNQESYREFFSSEVVRVKPQVSPLLVQSLDRIGPEIFAITPMDGLKFFALYQRYDSLGQAIAQLRETLSPSCLTHNDLKLNNILVAQEWENSNGNMVRLIDWERSSWGDPAFDLGTAIGSYLQMWLGSLVISNSLSIEESLKLATTPLELLQPSIAALALAYFDTFPEIVEYRPDFLRRVVQFAGWGLMTGILSMVQYQKTFNNTGIAMLQVAKALLCRPDSSMSTIFGVAIEEVFRSQNSEFSTLS
ncbi:phosphotransferase family protein [Okeania sp. SIO1F9]|uniref:phosphotransferase family protein n=1 Tax=Okeania sp. SIO1F9 TaxID=2607813 RepID=UPI00144CA838|nr:aminoglycoside phosphotransferase family protein [Okeania sp. SIO1F9]NET76714.1 aminoglycoside phosphotransferase family protein [Okeania sp. SIO1F9]